MIITWFKTKQDVWDTLKAMEKNWWVWKNWWELPTEWKSWERNFDKYNQEEWWFYLDYQNDFWYCSVNYNAKDYPKIDFKDAIKELTWKWISKTLTYETQYLRSDWTLFTIDSIDWKSIEDLKQEMKEAMWTVNKIRGLLKAHKNKFSN